MPQKGIEREGERRQHKETLTEKERERQKEKGSEFWDIKGETRVRERMRKEGDIEEKSDIKTGQGKKRGER